MLRQLALSFSNFEIASFSNYFFGFFKIDHIVMPNPISTIVGANRIRLKLKTASFHLSGATLPSPPDIRINPSAMTPMPVKSNL
jgi:hypothetical protein